MVAISPALLEKYLNSLIYHPPIKDILHNGLQVTGTRPVSTIALGVTASLEFMAEAVKRQADTVIVHHGFLLNNLVGQKRLQFAKENDLNVFGYHLPLDADPQLGNNIVLGSMLNLDLLYADYDSSLLFFFKSKNKFNTRVFLQSLATTLKRDPLVVNNREWDDPVIAICTGKAQKLLISAAELGANIFLSGEISESTVDEAKELDVTFISAGHYATERYGVQAVGKNLEKTFGLKCEFIEVYNVV